MSSHQDRLSELDRRINQIDGDIERLNEQYQLVASEFDGADAQSSMQKAASIEVAIGNLQREKTLMLAATQQTEAAIQHDEQVRQQDERHAVRADAKRIADAVATLHAEIDDALVQLRQMLERRMALLRELQNTGVADAVVVKLMQKGPVNRALAAAGLHRFVDISTPSPGSFLPLRNAHPILAGVGRVNGGGGHD
jgi:hypothetical protein